ncbi:chemotaxis protein CheW [Methylophaga sp. OBS1]|uniref:chemotaxis protein CheW n=1 Tax=Methylophaga sp. OBS1 TaxID=2991933 RepID=UPI00224FCCE6|nr:chemotaxis protein CheW [Methylophaga sp. OBS1]MCX4190874.1 chemotaxis protein CheW [Methylophaga sp. OBS1]MCX4192179.1 chemotaxis protein CheW [Methylophaga sp. OBS1]
MSEQLHDQQWLCFRIEDETYAHPVNQVREILDYLSPVPVPGAQSCVEGVLNVRGEIVTIVSSKQLLGLDEAVNDSEHIIVLETTSGLVGVTVDEVKKISVLADADMMPVERNQNSSPVKGTINHDDQLLILTDFERCINELEHYE